MNEIYFNGSGYLKVNTDDFEKAENILLKALADANIEFYLTEIELRDKEGNPI